MKNILTKKKFVALFATVCAFVLLLVGIPFAAAPASAAETRGTYIPTNPTVTVENHAAAATMHYYGDVGAENTYMLLGSNVNPNYGSTRKEGWQYDEVVIPVNSNGSFGAHYKWVRAYTKVNGIEYSSDTYYAYMNTWTLGHAIDGYKISGALTPYYYEGIPYDSTGKTKINISCVYNGYVGDCTIDIPASGINSDYVILNGVTLTVFVSPGSVAVKSSVNLTCNQYSYVGSYYAGFAFYAV